MRAVAAAAARGWARAVPAQPAADAAAAARGATFARAVTPLGASPAATARAASTAKRPKPAPPSPAAAAAAAASASRVVALAGNLTSAHDVEDLALTYGVPNAHIPGTVRPLAVVKVGGEVITKDIDNLTRSLRFLKDFGLSPVVVHGGGPQLNDELAKAGVKPEYIGGASRCAARKWHAFPYCADLRGG
jgi:hypothetical protein